MLGKTNNIMRQFLTITLLLLSSSITAQNINLETTFVEYTKSNISFKNLKLKEFIENHAQIKYDICTQKLIGVELENKLTALFDKYGTHINNMSANDQAWSLADILLI